MVTSKEQRINVSKRSGDRYKAKREWYEQQDRRMAEFRATTDALAGLKEALSELIRNQDGFHVEIAGISRGRLTLKRASGELLFFNVEPVLRPAPNNIGECRCVDLFSHDDNCPVFPRIPF